MNRDDAQLEPGPGPESLPSSDRDRDGTSAAWVRRLREDPGSNTVWDHLSDRYRNRILVYAAHRLGPQLRRVCDPEDVVNEAWMQIFARVDQFDYRHAGSLYAWLCQQVRRVILTKRRNLDRKGPLPKLHADLPSDAAMPDPPANAPGPITEAGARDLKSQLLESLEKVPLIYRRVLIATHFEQRGRNEVAEELSLKANTVSQQLKRGMELWRSSFGGDPLTHI